MRQYHDLTVADVLPETEDSRRILLDVPEALKAEFVFLPGQHLPLAIDTPDGELRRTYSICSAPGEWPLQIGVRVQPRGAFSGFVASELRAGDTIRAMPPFGQFHTTDGEARRYAGFAAGSGITPILAMIKTLLRDEPDSRFTLFYGNREQATTMFIEDLFALKNRFPERLQLQFVFSREEQEFPIAEGRLDRAKAAELIAQFFRERLPDEVFICGPDSMIDDIEAASLDAGIDEGHVHSERFGAPRKRAGSAPAAREEKAAGTSEVVVVMDGHRKRFSMPRADASIVDAAAGNGIDLPYSCKGGVCATCRTHVAEGEVDMALNYGLEPWEVEAGFVLACQCRPLTDRVVLDYDKA